MESWDFFKARKGLFYLDHPVPPSHFMEEETEA